MSAGKAEEQPAQAERWLVPRWVQLVTLPLAVVALWIVAKAAGKVLVMFTVASLVALLLNPLVASLSGKRMRRGLAVLAVFAGFFLASAGIAYLLAHPIASQAQALARSVPHIVSQANREVEEVQQSMNRLGLHVHFISQGKTAFQTLGDKVIKSASSFAEFGGELLKEAAGAVFDLVVIFVLSVYMLLYGDRIGELVRRAVPGGRQELARARRSERIGEDDLPTLVQRAVSRYVWGQLLFSTILGASAGVGLYVLGVAGVFPDGRRFALAFGLIYAVMELIPYVGPFLGALPAVLLALFTNPVTAIWVMLFFLALQQFEGHIVAPQIFGRTLRINPLLVIFALLFGLQVGGVIGALLALPLISVMRESALYFGRHLALEPWARAPGPML